MPETPPLFAPTAIPPLSPAPTFADPANFEPRADVHVAEVVAMVPLLNAENQKVFANAQAAFEGGQLANAARGLAVYKGPWSTLAGALAVPASVTHGADNELFMLLVDVADVAAHVPGVSASWKSLKKTQALPRDARTAAAQLTAADTGKWIDITAGAFTQAFAACSELGAGWWCYLGNSGGGDIPLDPFGAETIDGLPSYVMYPREVRLVQCDGVSLRSVVLNAFRRTYTASGTFVVPPGYAGLHHMLWAGGSGGSAIRNPSYSAVSGSGGGACAVGTLPASMLVPGASLTITLGSGGAGGVRSGSDGYTPGAAGGNSSIGSLVTAQGGSSGAGGAAFGLQAPGSTYGGSSSSSLYGGATNSTGGAYGTVFGGGADAPYASTVYGGAGGTPALSAGPVATDGVAPGGGGGSKWANGGTVTACNGARGECRLMGVI